MLRYFVKRLAAVFPLVLLVSLICFALMQATPGGPSSVLSDNPMVTPSDAAQMRSDFGYEKPVLVQFGLWLKRVVLHQNRPNPAHRATEIPFTLAGGGDAIAVTLRIFDPHGRLVRTLVDGPEPTARHYVISWDARDQMGRAVGSGIYYYQLRAGAAALTRRMVLLR